MTTTTTPQKKPPIPDEPPIPLLVKPWVYLYNTIPPKFYIPNTNVSTSFALCSCLFFCALYKTIHLLLLHVFHWPPYTENDVTRSSTIKITAICHSCLLCLTLGPLLQTQPFIPSCPMKVHPQWWQDGANAILEFCTGYMLYDAILNIFIARYFQWGGHAMSVPDYCYLVHHFATAYYMTATRVTGAGHVSAMVIMFFGELTNPFQNAFCMTRQMMKKDVFVDITKALHVYTEFSYAFLYFFIRGCFGPCLCGYVTYDIAFTKHGRSYIPIRTSIVWLIMLWAVLLGSYPWVLDTLDMLKDGLDVKYHKGYVGVEL